MGDSIQSTLQRAWLGKGLLARMLWPVSLVYGGLVALRARRYRTGKLEPTRLGVPVIVVGNVIAGGAGKTPTVIALVAHLQSRGLQVGIVTRGYGGQATHGAEARPLEVQPGSDVDQVGDEPLLLRQKTHVPVFVGRQRADAGRALLAAHPHVQVLVCDDGLQHLSLARDIEICVFDNRGAGNGWLLPAGPLRESWPRPVDVVLHTGSRPAFPEGFVSTRRLADIAVRPDGTAVPLAILAADSATRFVAVAGIAQPEAFFAMLRARGITLSECVALPDHYDFDSWKRRQDLRETVICTEKDAGKLWRHEPAALAVALEFTPEPAFFAAIDRLLGARLSFPASFEANPKRDP